MVVCANEDRKKHVSGIDIYLKCEMDFSYEIQMVTETTDHLKLCARGGTMMQYCVLGVVP